MIASIIINDNVAEAKLKDWGWQPKEVNEQEYYQNLVIGTTRSVKWYFGDASRLYTAKQAFNIEISDRLLKLI